MKDFLVYLAGPIEGCSYEGATSWRNYVQNQFNDRLKIDKIRCLSPMRHSNEFLVGLTNAMQSNLEVLKAQRNITMRDRYDCTRADLVFFYFLCAPRVSIGSSIEAGWADACKVPSLMVIEDAGNPHDHVILREIIPARYPDIDEAIDQAILILDAR